MIDQKGASSVRERMDHLYNNPDMSDLTITAVDQTWSWGQTSQEFIVNIYLVVKLLALTSHCHSSQSQMKLPMTFLDSSDQEDSKTTPTIRLAQLGKTMQDQYGPKICHT